MTTTLLPAKLDGVVTKIHIHGLDEASQLFAPFLQMRYVQLERGTACIHGAAARLQHMVVGRWGADRNKVEWLDVPRGRMLIVMPARGTARLGTTCVVPGQAMIAHGPTQLVAFTDREYRALFALMPNCAVGTVAQGGGLVLSSKIRLLSVSELRTRIFHRCVHKVLDDLPIDSSLSQLRSKFVASETALLTLCASWLREQGNVDPATEAANARCYAAVRARQHIDEHLDQPLSLASVCRASYSSPRALEYGFREIFGVSPIAYIRCSRLSRVRRDLYFAPQANGRITQLAMKWGFWHLSQFSKDYYDLFGELPSTTLGRATGRLDRNLGGDCAYAAARMFDVASDRSVATELAQIR